MADYAQLGVKYYVLYNPEYSKRDRHEPWEVYQLERGRYQLQSGEPFWIPEIGLGIGRVQGTLGGIWREWLAWYDAAGTPYPLPQELIRHLQGQLRQERQRAEQERQRAEQERQRAEQERQRAEQERQRSKQMEQALEQERLEKLRLLEQLRRLGVDVEEP
jgi:hypothetical protein